MYRGRVGLITTQVLHSNKKKCPTKQLYMTKHVTTSDIVTVTVTVFGNLYQEIDTAVLCGEVSVLLSVLAPVLLTLRHISAWKTVSVPGRSALQTGFRELSPQKTASFPASERVRQRPVYWWQLCSLEQKNITLSLIGCLVGQDLNHNTL